MATGEYVISAPLNLEKQELRFAVLQVLSSAPSSPALGQMYFDSSLGYARICTNATGPVWEWVATNALLLQGQNGAHYLARANHTGTQLAATISDFAEAAQDVVGPMFTGGEHSTGVAFAYDDTDGEVDLTITPGDLPGFDTQVRENRLDQMAAPTAAVSLNSQKITNLATPTADNDAVNKAYADALASGLDVHPSVRVATTAAGTLATSFENGDTVDGVTLATGDRILIKDQVSGAENGIYTVNASGAPTRATDADVSAEVTAGLFVFVEEGTANADSGWILTTNNPITLGTTALVFAQFSGAGQITAGAGLTKTGNTIDAVAGSTPGTGGPGGGLVVNANDIVIDKAVVARGYAQTFGDGSVGPFVLTHNLGTRQVVAQVFQTATPFEERHVPIDRTSTTTVTVRPAVSVASAEWTAVILVIGG